MKKIKVLVVTFLMTFIMAGMVASANAGPVYINLSTPTVASGEETSQAEINTIILPLISPAVELYKDEVGSESGMLAGSYKTTYTFMMSEPEEAVITYTGGTIVGPTAYLLTKDGLANDTNPATHAWYLYNLTALGWTGVEDITITGLWPDQGAFSHVTLYGTPVPVPAAAWLLGSGMLGLLGIRRRMKK
ncbi:VPLPA-CTERM protein sorting domain-containing protein [Syntrophus gentianae]|uniref:VPLPA-CTERM protein sorting domain-containing protein n=1 Tax=Syntrophus gentianae TaxID=43775 RepID=A0A1H7UWG1_9BACT|nr:VPLPA-CTERM sorting domain-containing protein [Syntrophus gentianae]SEM01166.1 VPLPA-CTERM protein sorting domain-containing protein [Syntrophus gentianae]